MGTKRAREQGDVTIISMGHDGWARCPRCRHKLFRFWVGEPPSGSLEIKCDSCGAICRLPNKRSDSGRRAGDRQRAYGAAIYTPD